MKISTKGRYAVNIMLGMALAGKDEYISLKAVAQSQGLSGKYLEQIMSILNRAGFVRSERGPQGGYILTKSPEQYTLGMILRLTEGSFAPVTCLEEDSITCPNREHCVTVKAWKRVNDAMNDVLNSITLADLAEWQETNNKTHDSKLVETEQLIYRLCSIN
jgi:Rrf2 family transcriptional regulator, cysteine metabolism repressor